MTPVSDAAFYVYNFIFIYTHTYIFIYMCVWVFIHLLFSFGVFSCHCVLVSFTLNSIIFLWMRSLSLIIM